MRFAVEYACPGFEARDRAFPIGIVAQDESGVYVRSVGIDADRVALACKLPAAALVHWEADARARIADPVWGPGGQPLDPRDPRWLDRFASAGMEAKFFWGPVRAAGGTIEEIAAAILAEAGA